MQKQEKILTLSKNLLFILKNIKKFNKFKFVFCKKSNMRSYSLLRKGYFKLNFFFFKKCIIEENKINNFLLNNFMYKKISFFKIINKKLNVFNNLFFKNTVKRHVTVILKQNNFFYTIILRYKKKLLFIKSSNIFFKNKKFFFVQKIMFITLKNSLRYFIEKYNFKKILLNIFLKKKRRLRKKGFKKYTKNFINSHFFKMYLLLYKYFKKLNVLVNLKLSFVKSHSIKTEKLKKKRRK